MKKLFFDIETIPDQREGALDKYLLDVHPPGNYKKQESIDAWMEKHAEAAAVENWKKSALEGIAGQICSIAWALDDDDPMAVTANNRKSEANLIEEFFAWIHLNVQPGEGRYSRIQWIGHNVVDFDIRFLYHRAVIYDLKPPCVIPINERHPGKHVFDTMKEWSGWKGYEKLDNIADALNLSYDSKVGEIDGSMVWDLYQAGQYNKICEYNVLDVIKTRDVYRRLTWGL
jgi:predicted PolB exonuclease-like 3'-5' exonuclease